MSLYAFSSQNIYPSKVQSLPESFYEDKPTLSTAEM